MTRVKFNPYLPVQNVLGDIFNELMNGTNREDTSPRVRRYSQPAVNIIEEKDKFILKIAIPGVSKKDIDIKLENNELIISSNVEVEENKEQENFVKREYSYDSFRRVFTIPKSINKTKIDAQHKNGVLTITLKKREEDIEKGPVSIAVK